MVFPHQKTYVTPRKNRPPPTPIREELNHRLENGEPGKRLIDWLATLPEVATLLEADFDGRPISEQNLSDGKRGGFVEWQLRRDLMYDT